MLRTDDHQDRGVFDCDSLLAVRGRFNRMGHMDMGFLADFRAGFGCHAGHIWALNSLTGRETALILILSTISGDTWASVRFRVVVAW